MSTLFDIVNGLASVVVLVWIVASWVLPYAKRSESERLAEAVRDVWAELRPVYLPAAVFGAAYDIATGHTGWFTLFGDAALIVNWWFLKDLDEDDRWKRRRRKAADKVKALTSGRLVVVGQQ